MKPLLQIFLICLAGNAAAQVYSSDFSKFGEEPLGIWLPIRATNMPSASEVVQKIATMDLAAREHFITAEIFAGNMPFFLHTTCPVAVTNVALGITNTGTFFVSPEYLAIGSDEDYLLMPISVNKAQQIADKFYCTLPTRKMVDAIYAAAEVKLAPTPIPPSAAMTTVPVFAQHNEIIRAQRQALTNAHPLGALVAGHKKDVVLSARLAGVTNKVAIYGWHQTNGLPIQPLYLGHVATWVDYSQCVRLVSQTMLVNGEKKSVAAILADPKLCGLISDEGVVTNARYPTNFIAPVVAEKINLPWPAKFSVTPHFGEWTREIRLADDVRILVNAPAPETFSSTHPVQLIFYALPNGNTIEQTIGKKLQSGDDWHFDLQHIGAQTRWLRKASTNQTIVVVYLEAGPKSWPAWRKTHSDQRIAEIFDGVRGIFSPRATAVVLASHSGGGSLIFGYLNALEKIPSDVKRLAFLDSNYGYDSKLHADKIKNWLAASGENYLCVLAYQDYLARLNGKPFVSEAGGTWGRSRAMLGDLGGDFSFASGTNAGLEVVSAAGGRVQFFLKENPGQQILHTVQVERNGFIHALLSGTTSDNRGCEYLGERAYSQWIQGN